MAPPFLGIDHAVVAVRDLNNAAKTWERLGFTITPKSAHPELGSSNHCIIMHGDYIELLSPGDHPATAFLRDFTAKGEGMAALAARTQDIVATRAALTQAGVKIGEPLSFTRPAVMPDGAVETAVFTVAMLEDNFIPGAMVFACQHHTPQHVWAQGFEKHANSAERISAVIFGATDSSRTARRFERIFDSVGRGGPNRSIEVRTGDAPIFVLPIDGLHGRYRGAAESIEGPCFAGLSIQVYDLEETARVLTANGVPFIGSTALHLMVHPSYANGVMLEFYKR